MLLTSRSGRLSTWGILTLSAAVSIGAGAGAQVRSAVREVRPSAVRQSVTAQTPEPDQPECVSFRSPKRLVAGAAFRVGLLHGLELRLSPGPGEWGISVGPVAEPEVDYLWVVSPPLRTAPHRTIGAAYGVTARQSVQMWRPLRFVVTRADHDAARAAHELSSAEETLAQLERLGRGRLSLVITDFGLRNATPRYSGGVSEILDWIAFTGEACVDGRADRP